jgi:hypothetical protein
MFASLVSALICASELCAMTGPGTIEDTIQSQWDQYLTVFYAEVVDTQPHEHVPIRVTNWYIRLKPLATLSGHLDAACVGEITADAAISNGNVSVIASVPKKGSKVVVLVTGKEPDEHGHYYIAPSDVLFFPKDSNGNKPALCEVTGVDDPKVTETIENLRKLRGKQREEAEQKAAAEKKGK